MIENAVASDASILATIDRMKLAVTSLGLPSFVGISASAKDEKYNLVLFG